MAEHRVLLYIYDLSQGMAAAMSMQLTGKFIPGAFPVRSSATAIATESLSSGDLQAFGKLMDPSDDIRSQPLITHLAQGTPPLPFLISTSKSSLAKAFLLSPLAQVIMGFVFTLSMTGTFADC